MSVTAKYGFVKVPLNSMDYPTLMDQFMDDVDSTIAGNSVIFYTLDSTTPLNNVTRLRFSDWNFISNSSFESWIAGINVAPDGWYAGGTITIARDSTPFQGTYSAAITFGAASDGELYAIFGANTEVDYTCSAYVTRVSGTGNARFVAQQNFGSYVEEVSVAMSITGGQQLVTLTFKPTTSGNHRIAFKATDSVGSVWRVDEVKVQESKQVATAWTPNFIDDSFAQNIWGHKTFNAGLTITNDTPLKLPTTKTPASSSAAGVLGDVCRDSDYIYVCVATNTWKRAALLTW